MKTILSLIIGFSVCLVLIAFVFVLYKPNEEDIPETKINKMELVSLKEFLEIVEVKKTFRTKVYYITFYADASEPYSEESLISEPSGPFLKVCAGEFPSVLYASHLAKTFNNFTMQKKYALPFDFRYCCIAYTGVDKCIRFSIARSSFDTIWINGQPYAASPEIIDALLKLLPVIDYEEAKKFIEKEAFR